MRMNKHAKILDLVVLVVVVLFVWMNPFDIHLIKVVSAFRPKKPPANLPPGFFGTLMHSTEGLQVVEHLHSLVTTP